MGSGRKTTCSSNTASRFPPHHLLPLSRHLFDVGCALQCTMGGFSVAASWHRALQQFTVPGLLRAVDVTVIVQLLGIGRLVLCGECALYRNLPSTATPLLFFFVTLVTGPRRSLSLKLSDTSVYEPQIPAFHCEIVSATEHGWQAAESYRKIVSI